MFLVKFLVFLMQLKTENSELEKQMTAMKETQEEFVAEVCAGCLLSCSFNQSDIVVIFFKISNLLASVANFMNFLD